MCNIPHPSRFVSFSFSSCFDSEELNLGEMVKNPTEAESTRALRASESVTFGIEVLRREKYSLKGIL